MEKIVKISLFFFLMAFFGHSHTEGIQPIRSESSFEEICSNEFPMDEIEDKKYPCFLDIWAFHRHNRFLLEEIMKINIQKLIESNLKKKYNKLANKCLKLAKEKKYDEANRIVRKQIYPLLVLASLSKKNKILANAFFFSTYLNKRGFSKPENQIGAFFNTVEEKGYHDFMVYFMLEKFIGLNPKNGKAYKENDLSNLK